MCEPTKFKFELPVGTWGTTEVEVEYPWHRNLDSIILPLLETAHEAQAERQKETREMRASEAYRVSHLNDQRSSELRAGDFKQQSQHPSEHQRVVPASNAAKVIMSNSAKRKKSKDKTLPSRPNEEVRVCLSGAESAKWMTMMRGDCFQNLLEAYAKECEPQKDAARLKVFWKGRWVKTLETPDDLGLETDAKFEVYELVQPRSGILVSSSNIPKGHQRDPSNASIKTIRSTISNDDRPVTVPTDTTVGAAIVNDQRPSKPASAHASSLSSAGLVAAEYQAQRVAFHSLRHALRNEGLQKASVPSPGTTNPQDPGKLQVPTPQQPRRSRSPSPLNSDPDPLADVRQSLQFANLGAGVPPCIPPLQTTKSKEDGIRASVMGFKYQNAGSKSEALAPLAPVELRTTIESGGRRVSNTFRTSWP